MKYECLPSTGSLRPGLVAVAAAAAALAALAGCEQRSAAPDGHPATISAGTELDDSVITTKVKTAIVADAQANGAETSVQTRRGEVMLSGFVDSQAQADRAVQLAKAVQGVQSVDNKLIVKSGTTTAGNMLDDSVITVKVKAALMSDAQTKASQIAVTTNKGVVLLGGFVDSADNQQRATTVARGVEGVQSVVNDTSIKK
jgi:hyperosmotically inducible protein